MIKSDLHIMKGNCSSRIRDQMPWNIMDVWHLYPSAFSVWKRVKFAWKYPCNRWTLPLIGSWMNEQSHTMFAMHRFFFSQCVSVEQTFFINDLETVLWSFAFEIFRTRKSNKNTSTKSTHFYPLYIINLRLNPILFHSKRLIWKWWNNKFFIKTKAAWIQIVEELFCSGEAELFDNNNRLRHDTGKRQVWKWITVQNGMDEFIRSIHRMIHLFLFKFDYSDIQHTHNT